MAADGQEGWSAPPSPPEPPVTGGFYVSPPPYVAPPSEPRKPKTWVVAVIAGVIGGILGAGVVLAIGGTPASTSVSSSQGVTTSAPAASVTIKTASEDPTFAEAVATKVTPSVVSISVEQVAYDVFSGKRVTQTVGIGSGVIIRQDGYILTNDHVVADADELLVTIGVDDLPATIVGRDPSTDLAVIKVDRRGLPAAEFGESATLRVGQPVVAIGSPFGLEKSVTSGIVSALGRSSLAEGAGGLTAYTSLIQTDAAINPGNSGGALCDAKGRLIGINTLIKTTSGSSAGIGFAIPIDFAKGIAEEIIATGKATHPYMGVGTTTIDSASAESYGLGANAGALVQTVVPGSPADKAGIMQGDIIVSMDGQEVTSVEDVFAVIRSHKVGDTIKVELVRGQKRLTVSVTLASDAERQ
ncbi:MAG: trypsin-like peptidase domain-containing protein [Actinomycetia bacterium]|nr:trypsin-like peptidase domain-containing protein [Actinomycetes bacterium]